MSQIRLSALEVLQKHMDEKRADAERHVQYQALIEVAEWARAFVEDHTSICFLAPDELTERQRNGLRVIEMLTGWHP